MSISFCDDIKCYLPDSHQAFKWYLPNKIEIIKYFDPREFGNHCLRFTPTCPSFKNQSKYMIIGERQIRSKGSFWDIFEFFYLCLTAFNRTRQAGPVWDVMLTSWSVIIGHRKNLIPERLWYWKNTIKPKRSLKNFMQPWNAIHARTVIWAGV